MAVSDWVKRLLGFGDKLAAGEDVKLTSTLIFVGDMTDDEIAQLICRRSLESNRVVIANRVNEDYLKLEYKDLPQE